MNFWPEWAGYWTTEALYEFCQIQGRVAEVFSEDVILAELFFVGFNGFVISSLLLRDPTKVYFF